MYASMYPTSMYAVPGQESFPNTPLFPRPTTTFPIMPFVSLQVKWQMLILVLDTAINCIYTQSGGASTADRNLSLLGSYNDRCGHPSGSRNKWALSTYTNERFGELIGPAAGGQLSAAPADCFNSVC